MKKKYESMFVVHVRYDVNAQEYGDAADVHEILSRELRHYLQHKLHTESTTSTGWHNFFVGTEEEVDNSERSLTGLKARVSWAGICDSALSEASDNRRNPNVWFLGRLTTIGNMTREWASYVRSLMPNDPFASRARQFDTREDTLNDGRVQLPTLPFNTMKLVFHRTRENYNSASNVAFNTEMKRATLDVLESLFEDGLPVDRELTANELNEVEPF